jgi:hypothetical protein
VSGTSPTYRYLVHITTGSMVTIDCHKPQEIVHRHCIPNTPEQRNFMGYSIRPACKRTKPDAGVARVPFRYTYHTYVGIQLPKLAASKPTVFWSPIITHDKPVLHSHSWQIDRRGNQNAGIVCDGRYFFLSPRNSPQSTFHRPSRNNTVRYDKLILVLCALRPQSSRTQDYRAFLCDVGVGFSSP